MKQLLAITLVMFGVSCAAPDFFGKRDRAANAFANAILAGNSSEAKVFTDENMSGGLPWTSAVENSV